MPLTLNRAEFDSLDQIFRHESLTATSETLAELLRRGLIARDGDQYSLTPKGRLALAPIAGSKQSELD